MLAPCQINFSKCFPGGRGRSRSTSWVSLRRASALTPESRQCSLLQKHPCFLPRSYSRTLHHVANYTGHRPELRIGSRSYLRVPTTTTEVKRALFSASCFRVSKTSTSFGDTNFCIKRSHFSTNAAATQRQPKPAPRTLPTPVHTPSSSQESDSSREAAADDVSETVHDETHAVLSGE